MATVLVTGGAGYIGSHVCKALAAGHHVPVTYDNLSAGHRQAVRWGPLEEGDLADWERLHRVFRRYKPDTVIHLAAHAYVAESVQNPGKYYRNNVAGSLTLLEVMRDADTKRLIFSSTCSTYGDPEYIPMDEKHPQRPINPYGASKLMVEQMIRDFAAAHGLSYVILRYFNAAGADPDGDIGESHDPETHLVPLAIQAAMGIISGLDIYGTDYATPDGTAIRDYIHVTDLAVAHVRAMGYLAEGNASTAVNLGTGRGYSVREIVRSVEAIGKRTVPMRAAPRREGDPAILVAAVDRSRELLSWVPAHSDLDRIIETAWNWQASVHRTSLLKQRNP